MSLLRIERMTKRFGGLTAVSDLSTEICNGEIVGIIGPNGAGKTTVFNCIAGYYPPNEGEIIFREQSLGGFDTSAICRCGLARTFQIVRPFGDLTVLENTMVGSFLHNRSPDKAKEKAHEVLKRVGLEPLESTRAKNLTLAHRKRLEMARALATEPSLLLLDEVMAGLTPVESDGVVDLIRKIQGTGVTMLIIEHVMRAIMRVCDRILVLDHGVKIAEGTPTEVAKDETVIKAYLGKEYKIA
jgi:branched-chain amino acid transport system ATP-binding protein